ncbi:hypothetical protein KXV36_009377 [Aspergillus fumigatus]|nr:hypothetical protein KXX37_009293 [Aspergillus fumigatus]KAH3080899.1 hypothetical protein KXV36_009377 [Aspergillus fumigatus]
MKGQDWSTISDLLFTPTIEYLAIDSCYCELAMNGVSYSQGSIIPTFSNLKALTIYKPDAGTGVHELCQMLRCCDLQIFHLDEWARRPADGIGRDDLAEVLLCLRQHQNLEMLALILSHCASPSRSTRVKEQVNTWPRLEALYLQEQPQEWLELLPTLDELQILQLPTISPRPPTFKQTKLTVKSLRFGEGYYLGEDQFVHLLRAMPHLEFLDLDVKFQMDGETLRELVLHCPRLVVLDLRYTQLHLSIGTMIGLHPFRQLETMRFACIYFKDLPRLQSDAGLTIATLWRRIFPRLRHVACFSDRSHAMEDDWSEESEADNDVFATNPNTQHESDIEVAEQTAYAVFAGLSSLPFATFEMRRVSDCCYAPSRRGGLDRAALAERRKRLSAADGPGGTSSANGSSPQRAVQAAGVDFSPDSVLLDPTMSGNGTSNAPLIVASPAQIINIEDDALIDAYYKKFHKSHPFVLPRKHLAKMYQDLGRQPRFTPLIAVLRFIGDLYTSKSWSIPLQEYTETCFAQAAPSDPIMVQCRLLYSVALFWHDYKADAKREMDRATKLAIDLQMFRQEFAASHGADDPVLKESWRRTWWMLFIVDAYYAGTLGTMNLTVVDIPATVELPCEESEYESGNIPQPKTLEEFNCREFSPEGTKFSSFAYLIGAVQCAASAISVAPKTAVKEDSARVIQAADCSLDGWRLLLPADSKQVMTDTGEIDELMFQAHLLVHVATIGLHRPFSTLKFNAIEDVSSCAREAPLDTPTPDLVNVHTVRVLRSAEAQIRLLALPVREFCHSPFTTCMVSEGTLALLSACKFLFKGKDLAIARDQIRMTIGCLKVLGEVWPRTARNVRELQTIGQYVLGVGSRESNSDASNPTPGLHALQGDGSRSSSTNVLSSDTDILSSISSIQDLCGWYGLGDLPDLPWGIGDGL